MGLPQAIYEGQKKKQPTGKILHGFTGPNEFFFFFWGEKTGPNEVKLADCVLITLKDILLCCANRF